MDYLRHDQRPLKKEEKEEKVKVSKTLKSKVRLVIFRYRTADTKRVCTST